MGTTYKKYNIGYKTLMNIITWIPWDTKKDATGHFKVQNSNGHYYLNSLGYFKMACRIFLCIIFSACFLILFTQSLSRLRCSALKEISISNDLSGFLPAFASSVKLTKASGVRVGENGRSEMKKKKKSFFQI